MVLLAARTAFNRHGHGYHARHHSFGRKEPMLDDAIQVGTPLFQDFDLDTSFAGTQAPCMDDAAVQAATKYFETSP